MRNTEERLRKRREKRAIFVSRFCVKKNEAKKKEKILKRRGGVCDDDVMTTTRDDRTRALVLVHTYTHITREVCVIAFYVLLRARRG